MGQNKIKHPYFPRDLKIPNFVPNEKDVVELLGVFFSLVGLLIIITWIYSGTKQHLKGKFLCRAKICWFVSCVVIHGILEGYFSVFHKTLAGEQSYLAQMWKEYGKGDSRYVSQDTFAVCMESVTAFVDAPLAAAAAYTFLTNSPKRYIFQILLSLCQLYGDVLYFSTEIKDGFIHSELYHPLYFWFYFMFLNAIWIIIPFICILESYFALTGAQAVADSTKLNTKKHKSN